jgi:retron-type reverse transcriptase
MMERILAPENLAEAWKRVKANKGAPGIDGMTIEAFPAFCRKHWPRIRQAMEKGTYRPAPVRRVFIPKPDGSQRPLGVPTVLDRVIQSRSRGMAQVLGPRFEPDFSKHSYGFREGRNAHQAVRQMEAGWEEGRRHAVDCDLKRLIRFAHPCGAACRQSVSLRSALRYGQPRPAHGRTAPEDRGPQGSRTDSPLPASRGGPARRNP